MSAIHVHLLSLVNLIYRQVSSLDDDVEELVPVSRLEATQAHSEALDLLDDLVLHVDISLQFLLVLAERHLKDAFFYQIIVVEGAVHLLATFLVVLTQRHKLLALGRLLVEHVWIEERTYVFIVAF